MCSAAAVRAAHAAHVAQQQAAAGQQQALVQFQGDNQLAAAPQQQPQQQQQQVVGQHGRRELTNDYAALFVALIGESAYSPVSMPLSMSSDTASSLKHLCAHARCWAVHGLVRCQVSKEYLCAISSKRGLPVLMPNRTPETSMGFAQARVIPHKGW